MVGTFIDFTQQCALNFLTAGLLKKTSNDWLSQFQALGIRNCHLRSLERIKSEIKSFWSKVSPSVPWEFDALY